MQPLNVLSALNLERVNAADNTNFVLQKKGPLSESNRVRDRERKELLARGINIKERKAIFFNVGTNHMSDGSN